MGYGSSSIKDVLTTGTKIFGAGYDGNSLYFVTDKGAFKGEPFGDCCARCYVQHVSGSEALSGATIQEIGAVGGAREEGTYGDVSDTWGHLITTNKGRCTIEMRVEHNGYYGGSLDFSEFAIGAVHEDCWSTPALGVACGCLTDPRLWGSLGKTLDDF